MKTLKAFWCLMILLFTAVSAQAGIVTVKLQGNYTVTTGTTKISIPQSWMEEGHAYMITAAPVSGNTSAYGDPYIWSVVYVNGSTTKRVVYQSRHTPDLGERAYLQEDMWNTGENRAEFHVKCEVSSCYMRLTVYEREEGTFDRKTFYRDGIEFRVVDGQYSLYKDFYHSIEKNGDYGLQVDYEANRYIYLWREDNFDKSGANALSFWIRSSGSIDEDDLTIAMTTGNHNLITSWLPLSNYVTIAASHTWYKVIIPLSDINPSNSSIRGLAINSYSSGFVYFDDVELVSATIPLKLRLPVNGYTPYTVPVSAVMDNSLESQGGSRGVITTYNGQQGRFENGCKEYVGSNSYIDCAGSIVDYTFPGDVLGYKRTGGGSFSLGINYDDGVSSGGQEYIFYDEHTGYDFVPSGSSSLNVPVYAAAGGTVSHGNSTWNEIIVTHGGTGCKTHYLHMKQDSYLISSGATVQKGTRIGTIGGTGGVGPHLHFTVVCDGDRIDPYAENMWE